MTVPGSSGSDALAISIECERFERRLTISTAVFLRGNSPKNSSMYWISSAPCSSSYCVIRYSTLPLALCLLGYSRPGVAQRDDTVEHGRAGTVVRVDAEVAEAFELEARARPGAGKARLDLTAAQDLERLGIHVVRERPARFVGFRILHREQTIVEPDFRRARVRGRHPVQRRLDLPAVRRITAARPEGQGDAALGV